MKYNVESPVSLQHAETETESERLDAGCHNFGLSSARTVSNHCAVFMTLTVSNGHGCADRFTVCYLLENLSTKIKSLRLK